MWKPATSSAELERTVNACVEVLGPMADTLAADPQETLVPPERTNRSSGVMPRLAGAKGRLVLEGVLGEGGMGVVHLATQTSLARKSR